MRDEHDVRRRSILMRHAVAESRPVAALSVGMIGRPVGRSLVSSPCRSHLSPTMLPSALGRTGDAAAATRTERDQLPAETTDGELQVGFHHPFVRSFGTTRQASTGGPREQVTPPGLVKKQRIPMAVYSRSLDPWFCVAR